MQLPAHTLVIGRPVDLQDEAAHQGRINDHLHLHTGPAVAAFLMFLLAYTPCMATIAAQLREIGWRWTLVGMAAQTTIAWALAVATFQIGRLFW